MLARRDICSVGIYLYKSGDLFLLSVKIGIICIWDYSLIRNLMPLLQTSEKKVNRKNSQKCSTAFTAAISGTYLK